MLNLTLLQIDELRVKVLTDFIGRLSSGENGESNESSAESSESYEESVFIPKTVIAEKLKFNMLPYKIAGINLYGVVLNGSNIDINMKELIFDRAKLTLKAQSNIGNLILRMDCRDDMCVADSVDIQRLDLEEIIDISKAGEKNKSEDTGKSKTVIADIPFVPDIVDIKKGKIKLLSQKIEGVEYDNAGIDVKDLAIDLRREFVTVDRINTHIDTDLGSSDIDLSIDKKEIKLNKLRVDNIDIDKIISLSKNYNHSNSVKSNTENGDITEKKNIDIPYIPENILISSAEISTIPYKSKDISINSASVDIKDALVDISKQEFENGMGRVDISTDIAEINISALLQGRGLLIDSDSSKITLKDALMNRYKIPLKASAISPISLAGSVDERTISFDINTKGRDIYSDKNSSFKIDLNRLSLNGVYDINSSSLKSTVSLDSDVSPFATGVKLKSDISYTPSSGAEYAGKISVAKLSDIPKEAEGILRRFGIDFKGSEKNLSAYLKSDGLRGSVISKDMKRAKVHISSNGRLKLKGLISDIPKELKKGWLSIALDSDVNMAKPLPVTVTFDEKSNLVNMSGKMSYDKHTVLDAKVNIPKSSLLNKFDKNLKLSGFSPMKISLKPQKEKLHLILNSKVLKADSYINTDNKRIKGKLRLAGTSVDIKGKTDGDITMSLKSSSVKKMMDDISRVYSFESPHIDGDLSLSVTRKSDGTVKADISSKKFIPDSKARIKSPVNNLKLALSADTKNKIFYIDSYSVESGGMKFFATKRSKISLKKELLKVESLWVNDELKAKGNYDIKHQNGKFNINAKRFKIIHENAKMDISANMAVKIKKGKVDAEGKIYILGGRVFYNLQAKHYVSDEDIVIVQHMKKKKDSFFEKSVKLKLLIESKKALLFKQKDVEVALKPSMSIIKEFNAPLMVLGSIDLKKGGYYNFEGKKFVLEKSAIYFTGKPTAPLLNIRLVYRRYGNTIWITITGTGTEPSLNFSSSPYMTRDQILSFILFDTKNSGNSTEDMLSLVGGGLAKSILGNMGLKIDTLVLSQEGFEVGKKISDKVSVIYDQKDESKVIVRIEHSPKVETDISVGQDSQSVDIIYKREY